MSIAIPAVLEKSDIDEHIFYRLINHLNCTQKYIKAISLSDRLWILYERELIDEDDRLEHVISEMITSLESAILNLYNSIQESEGRTDEEVESNTDEKSDIRDNESDCVDNQNEQETINE